jgi:alkylation response protein AidB-like acyl-CoA dehydrogenase
MAHWADMMFALVRTSETGPRQQGLSLLLIDMQTPGVSVRPIRTIDAREHINDVFLDEVRVPAANLVGAEGQGWACAKFIVSNERVLVTELGKARRYLDLLYELSAAGDPGGRRLRASAGWRRRIAQLELEVECLRSLAYEAMAAAQAGSPPGVDASVLKIRGSQVQQALLDTIVEVLGAQGLPAHERAAGLLAEHFYARASSIYGGSNEIQTNIIAKGAFTT